jgi:poly-gamma-glutamate capsule biosynthesis protein CapA/YwtB (metallophosphatase superfamily)
MKKLILLSCLIILLQQLLLSNLHLQTDSLKQSIYKTKVTDTIKSSLVSDTIVSQILSLTYDSLALIKQDSIISACDTNGKDTNSLSIVMVGDVMPGTNYPSSQYLPPGNNCYLLLDPVKPYLQNADITFCNLEGVFAGESGTPKNCKDPKTCYVFRIPDEYANCLVDAGFDVVSVANNHVNDFGYAGRMHAATILKQSGMHFAGFVDYPYTIFYHDSLRIGFCAFSTNSGVMDLRDYTQAKSIVKFLADSCDIVIVSMHGGAEGADFQHVTRKTETFLGANRGNVYEFAHRLIDAGADVIIGHGPHVTRAMEIYNDRFIAYSLGNFCTYSRFNISGPNGIAPLVRIQIDNQGRFIEGNITAVKQTGEGGPQIDLERKVIFKLQNLIQADFPGASVVVDNEGRISSNNANVELP